MAGCLTVCELLLCISVINGVLGLHHINGQWTWVDGSKSVNAQSTVNVSRKDVQQHYPGARHGTAAWTDINGRVWMYGGQAAEGRNNSTKLDELWMFDTKTNNWHYVGASVDNKTWPVPCVDCAACSHGNQAIVFGGVINRKALSLFHTWVFNMTAKKWSVMRKVSPPPREQSTFWCEQDRGVLWVYGGLYNSKHLKDMWQFSFATMEWNEIHIPRNASSPRERFSAVSWVNHDGKLYLFGGNLSVLGGLMSDLWVFSTTLKQWKLLKGNSNKHSQSGIYRHRGIPSNLSMPGCRSGASSWIDNQGNLWMFGGRGCDANNDSSVGFLSDLWMFNVSSLEWTWIGGPSRKNGEAFYGEQGKHSAKNMPGPREAALTFRQGNNLWIFGGFGRDQSQQEGALNDMWVYCNFPLGPPSKGDGLPGDTLDMPYTYRLMIALGILTVAMIISLLVCYRRECNIMYWRYKKRSPRVKYEPLQVKMQVPDV